MPEQHNTPHVSVTISLSEDELCDVLEGLQRYARSLDSHRDLWIDKAVHAAKVKQLVDLNDRIFSIGHAELGWPDPVDEYGEPYIPDPTALRRRPTKNA